MMIRLRFVAVVTIAVIATGAVVHAQMRGHGGPVRAIAIAPDGQSAISGSFDTSVIRWSVGTNTASAVLRFHEGAVNAVALLPDGRAASSGEDGRIAVWQVGPARPATILQGHRAPVVSLAVSPDGAMLGSASWDHTARLWPLAGGEPRSLEGHRDNVNGVAFSPDGRSVVTAGYDATVRIWPLAGGAAEIVTLPTPLNTVAIAPDGEIIAGGADGRLHFLTAIGKRSGEVEVGAVPIIALAISPDGNLIAAGGIRGSVAILDRAARRIERTLVGPGLPVWSVAFFPDSRTLLTGGTDRMIRRWDAIKAEPIGDVLAGVPEDPLAAYAGDPGAEVYRACIACHTLNTNDGVRAGPTLAGVFGRRIGSLPDYDYSDALRKMDIVWTPETVSALFEKGPNAYTPGTKMPEQRIGSAEDRAALMRFLMRVTR